MAKASHSDIITRKETEIFLIGQPIDGFRGMKIPSKGDVIRRCFYLIRENKATVKQASSIVVKEVMGYWQIAKIPTMVEYNIIPKVEKEYSKWRALW